MLSLTVHRQLPIMTPDRWSKVKNVLDAALDCSPSMRVTFVEEACGGDREIVDEVLALLDAYDDGAAFFSEADDAATMLFGGGEDPLIGRRVGPYRLVRHIGKGGMGAVYLGVRDDGRFEQQVAVKVVHPGLGGEGVVQRFQAEGQILAGLDHAGIARVFDGGALEDGRPYLVMEYVRGRPIDRFCDEEALSVDARLALFREVCAAVHYAHQNLVVHRDLKPSNILVTDAGSVRLLDFGVAKLLEPEAVAWTVPVTHTGLHALTPEYASPEQVRGETITTAADVYALGVLLYRLLTGCSPYRGDNRSIASIVRAINEADPERPSAVVLREEPGTSVTPGFLRRTRGQRPASLAHRLTGDLDNIVLKAMRKEPRRRYASAGQLADDIERHLQRLPVSARRDTFTYRASRVAQRHFKAVVLATVLLVTILASSVVLLFQQREMARERDRARFEAAKAEQVTAFLVRLFEDADPFEEGADVVSIEELLARATAHVDSLATLPEVQAEMYVAMAEVFKGTGRYGEADSLLRIALAQQRAHYGERNPDVASTLSELGWLSMERGDYGEAERLLRRAQAIHRSGVETTAEDRVGLYSNLGLVLLEQGTIDEAERMLREALTTGLRAYDADDPRLARVMNNLAMVLARRGDLEAAESFYLSALELRRRVFGDRHPDVADNLNNLALLKRGQGAVEEAIPLMERALALRRDLLGSDHPRVATSLNGLGLLMMEAGHAAAGEPLLREALHILRARFGSEHPHVGANLYNLGAVLEAQGKLAEAAAAYDGAAEMLGRLLPSPHVRTGRALVGQGRVLLARGGAPAEAEARVREGRAMLLETVGEAHWVTAAATVTLGATLAARHRHGAAEPLIEEGYATLQSLRGPDDWYTRRARRALTDLRRRQRTAGGARGTDAASGDVP